MKNKFLFLLGLSIALLSAYFYLDPGFAGIGLLSAMTYIPISVIKKQNATPGNKRDRIVVFDWDDVASFARVDGQALIDGNIVMKSGKYMIEVYGTVSTITPSYSTEGDPDARGLLHAMAFNHPGEHDDVMDFIQNHLNKNLGVIVQKCDSNLKRVYGSPCAPLQLVPTGVDDENMNAQQLEFEASARTRYVPPRYEGTLTLSEVTGTFTADDATPSVAAGVGQYQTTDNASANAFTTLDDAQDGGIYTLLGSGGSNPSTISGGDFLLKNGTAWTALAGSQITFKAFKDGASSFKFIETHRS